MINMPKVPINPNIIIIDCENRILNEAEVSRIDQNPYLPVIIKFKGDSFLLDRLMQQLSFFRINDIELNIVSCILDYTVCLPFHYLGNNVSIKFFDDVKYGSGFNDYLMNCNDVIFNEAIPRLLDEKERTRIIQEKNIRASILTEVLTKLDERNIDINTWDSKQKMNFFFKLIKDNYPYDWSITNNGHYIPESTLKGGTALAVYQRGKGICEGRSKLLKIVTNNNTIKLPCYLVDGDYGSDGHEWNEIITEDGNILEYDLSFGTICSLEELENYHKNYKNIRHEYSIEKKLKRNR